MGRVKREKSNAVKGLKNSVKLSLSAIQKRGIRLKRLRLMTGLSRREIEKKYRISANTLRSWEGGLHTGLTEQGAKRVLSALKEEGVRCSVGWLLEGEGNGPDGIINKLFEGEEQLINALSSSKSQPSKIAARDVQTELATFCRLHKEAIYFEIIDDGMEPFYKSGDYVAGIRQYDEEISALIGKNCIVETQKGESYVRQLKFGSKPGYYNLMCLNTQTSLSNPVLYDVEIVYAAPIVWHRTKQI